MYIVPKEVEFDISFNRYDFLFCTNESFSLSECQEMALSKPEHPKTMRNIHMFDNIWTEEKFPFRDSLRYVYDDILTNKKPNHNF